MSALTDRSRLYVFHEEQRFRQKWLWALLLGVVALGVGVFGWGAYQQLVLGKPFGDEPASDQKLLALTAFVFAFMFGMLLLFYTMRLTTRLDDRQLELHFFPFKRRIVPLADIERFEARAYNPIEDYGGWGIKYGGKELGWVYNVSGDRGVFLYLRDGKRLMVGSQRAEELAEKLKEVKGRG